MNNYSKRWFYIAIIMLLVGACCGPIGGGIMASGIALFIYTWSALKRAKRLRQEIVQHLTAERTFSDSRLVVNQNFSECLQLQWNGTIALDMAVCCEERLCGIRYGKSTQHLISLYPHQKIRLENDLLFKTIGHFSLGAVMISVSRDWGVAEVSCPVKTNSQVLVHPHLFPVISQGVQNSMVRSLSSGIHRHQNPGDGAELYEIRDYVSGDPFKKILWSATAKTGKLIVRENETDINIPIMFLLNTSWFLRFGSPKMIFDQLSETALGIANSAIQAGDPFGFCLYGDAGQTESNYFMLPDNRKNKLGVLLQSLLNIRVQQTPPEQLDVQKMERIVKDYLQASSGNDFGEKVELSVLLKQEGYLSESFSSGKSAQYASLLNRVAEDSSLPIPILHSRYKAPDTIERELEMQETNLLKNMLKKILPQLKGHAVFIVAARPYENDDTLLALSHMLQCIPAFHHTLIVLYPDYTSFAGIDALDSEFGNEMEAILKSMYSPRDLIYLDYNRRFSLFQQAIRRAGGSVQNINAVQNTAFIMSAVNRLRTIQGGRRNA